MLTSTSITVPPTDIVNKIQTLRQQMSEFSQRNIPVPICGGTLEIVQAAMELKNSFQTLPKPKPLFGLNETETEEYLLGCLIKSHHFVDCLNEVITYAEVSDAMLGNKDITIVFEIPAGNMFEDEPWFGQQIDIPQTRKNFEEVIKNLLGDEGLSVPLWDGFVSIKVTDEPGKGDICKLKAPSNIADYFEDELLPAIDDAIAKALSDDNLPDVVEEKPESKWWRRETQVYIDEEIRKEVDDITFVSTILRDDFEADLYDDCLSPAAKKAYRRGDWGYVGVETAAFNEWGDQLCEPETSWGIENIEKYALEMIEEHIGVLQGRLQKPIYDDGFRQMELALA